MTQSGTVRLEFTHSEPAVDLGPIIAELRAAGVMTLAALAALAADLNEKNIPAARGGAWSPVQVSRVLKRVGTG